MKAIKKAFKDVKSFIVNRKTWYRGKGDTASCLLNNANNRCCLGFYASACGVEDKAMRNLISPKQIVEISKFGSTEDKFQRPVKRHTKNWITKLVDMHMNENSKVCQDLMVVNDDMTISDEVREEKLTKLFASIGIKVKFIG